MSRIIEAIDFDINTPTNWKYDFSVMCRKYGREFIPILKDLWKADGGVNTEEKFCEINGIPHSFFVKTIKG